MEPAERESIAKDWEAKYGEEIIHNSLWPAASRAIAHKFELEVEASRFAVKIFPVLKRQETERLQLLKDHLPNRSKSFVEYMEDADDVYPPESPVSLRNHLRRHIVYQTPADYRDLEMEAARLPKWAEEHPDYRGYAFGRACYEVSEWIRAHKKDGKTSWPDVATCLLWHGWDLCLSHPEKAAGRAAERWRSRALSGTA